MTMPSPFEVSRHIGNNLAGAFAKVQDENAIESILTKATKSGDPKILQDSIGQILSQVSPQRQSMAIKYLENSYQRVLENQQKKRQQEASRRYGVDADLPPTLQAAVYKEGAKQKRLNDVYPNKQADQGVDSSQPTMNQPNQNATPSSPLIGSLGKTKEELIRLSGHPDKEISEPAKQDLKNIQEQEKINQKKMEGKTKLHTDISQEILKENEKESQSIIQSESALALMEDAIANGDLSFWSLDNLAELTGIEGFRSKEGALFKTAGKEFFLGTLTRAGARPNQFIEKQIVEMLPKIGRSTAANLSVARAFKNEIDLKKEKIRLTRELADEYERDLGYVPRNIGQVRDEKLKVYAENKQKELNNDLRAYKSIEDKASQPLSKVNPGTPISKVVSKAILDQYDKKDPNRKEKARKEAQELGYTF